MTTILNAISYTLIIIIILWLLKNGVTYLFNSISYLDPIIKIYICVGLIAIVLYYGFQN